jgi:hypothetical protein
VTVHLRRNTLEGSSQAQYRTICWSLATGSGLRRDVTVSERL